MCLVTCSAQFENARPLPLPCAWLRVCYGKGNDDGMPCHGHWHSSLLCTAAPSVMCVIRFKPAGWRRMLFFFSFALSLCVAVVAGVASLSQLIIALLSLLYLLGHPQCVTTVLVDKRAATAWSHAIHPPPPFRVHSTRLTASVNVSRPANVTQASCQQTPLVSPGLPIAPSTHTYRPLARLPAQSLTFLWPVSPISVLQRPANPSPRTHSLNLQHAHTRAATRPYTLLVQFSAPRCTTTTHPPTPLKQSHPPSKRDSLHPLIGSRRPSPTAPCPARKPLACT